MSIGQKVEKFADAIYEKGKTDIISNSKYIEMQATGKVIRLDDVSEIAHKVKIKAGVESKNLFDGMLEEGGINSTNGLNYTSTSKRTVNYIPIKPNTTYTISRENTTGNIRTRFYDKDKNYIEYGFSAKVSPMTFTTKDNYYYLRLDLIGDVTNLTEKIQVELGSVATPYEPYIPPSTEPAEVKVYGKNLFNNDTSLLKDVTYQGATAQGTRIGYEPLVLPAGDYTFTLNNLGTVANKYIYGVINDKDGNFVKTCNLLANTFVYAPLFITLNEGDKIYIFDGYSSLSPTRSAKHFNDVQIQLESGPIGTDFEEFKEPQTITATPEGVKIPSDCEGMYLIADNNITVDYWGSYRKITSLRKWWYDYTKNMPNSGAPNAFSYYNWTDETFNPQDDMICSSANNMFAQSRIKNIRGILKRNKVKLIFLDTLANHTQFYSIFMGSHVQYLPYLRLPTTSSAYGWFQSCSKLIEVDGYECAENHMFESSSGTNKTFLSCTELVKIIFHGTVGNTINMQWSTKLNFESVVSLFKCLKIFATDDENYKTQTVTLSAETWALTETEEFKAELDGLTGEEVCTAKGWNKA